MAVVGNGTSIGVIRHLDALKAKAEVACDAVPIGGTKAIVFQFVGGTVVVDAIHHGAVGIAQEDILTAVAQHEGVLIKNGLAAYRTAIEVRERERRSPLVAIGDDEVRTCIQGGVGREDVFLGLAIAAERPTR